MVTMTELKKFASELQRVQKTYGDPYESVTIRFDRIDDLLKTPLGKLGCEVDYDRKDNELWIYLGIAGDYNGRPGE